jgi:predicted nucleotide-binding protein
MFADTSLEFGPPAPAPAEPAVDIDQLQQQQQQVQQQQQQVLQELGLQLGQFGRQLA